MQHLRDILANPDTDTLDFLQDFKLDLFTEEIYIYTPKGDMRVLPKDATALDFAFDIHSELGARCIGAKVNYRLVPISHAIKSGDQVDIITSSKQKPQGKIAHQVLPQRREAQNWRRWESNLAAEAGQPKSAAISTQP